MADPRAASSDDLARLRRGLLAAREERQARIEAAIAPGRWRAIVAVSLCVPGVEKAPHGSDRLLAWAVDAVAHAVRELRTGPGRAGPASLDRSDDALGPFALLGADVDPEGLKRACVAIEGSTPAARLVDLDVYAPSGAPLARAALRLPARPCLLCAEPARECIAASRHPAAALAARARALLDPRS